MFAGTIDPVNRQPVNPPGNSSLTISKQFKGLELEQPARLLETRSEAARLQVADPGFASILHGEVRLKSDAFAIPIQARVQAASPGDGVVHLSGFTFSNWKERQAVRVQPKDRLQVALHWQGSQADLSLEDISVQGAGVLADVNPQAVPPVQQGALVHLDFQLGPCSFHQLEAVVVYQVQIGMQAKKLGLSLFPDGSQRDCLECYVTQRSQEIIDEVKREWGGLKS